MSKYGKQILSITLILVIGLIVGSIWQQSQADKSPQPAGVEEGLSPTIDLAINFGDGNTSIYKDTKFTAGETLFDVMLEKTEEEDLVLKYEEYGDLGALITQIGNDQNGIDDKFWQFWVNGKYSQVGVSYYVVQGSDIIEWRYTNDRQGAE